MMIVDLQKQGFMRKKLKMNGIKKIMNLRVGISSGVITINNSQKEFTINDANCVKKVEQELEKILNI
jgi:hypothetical protein